MTSAIFQRVSIRQHRGGLYVNQNITIRQAAYDCLFGKSVRKRHFPRDFGARTFTDLCFDPDSRKVVAAIVSDLLTRTLDRVGGRERT